MKGSVKCLSLCVCVQEDVSGVCLGTVPLCNPCLFSLWSGIPLCIYHRSGMTGQTNKPSIDEQQRGTYPLCSREKERERERKGRGRESKVNLSKSLLCGVQTESALYNGLINGTMSRSGRAIIVDNFALWGYLWGSSIAIQQMIWILVAYQCGSELIGGNCVCTCVSHAVQ